jgi:predicted HTH transcriptional regulator
MYRALIVCNSRFPDDPGALGELYGPKMDGVLLRDALTDHDTGMFDRSDVQIINEEASSEVSRAVDDFFSSAEPDDTLFFYYSGHGRTRNQQLFLCTRNTVVDRLHSTSISESTLNAIVASSFAQVKILVLDCCFSGMLKGNNLIEGLSGTGRYVLAATSAIDRANDSSLRGAPSPFTRVLAEALVSKAQDSNSDGAVDLDDLYAYLESVPFEGPRPHRKFDGSGSIPIARRINQGTTERQNHHLAPGDSNFASDNSRALAFDSGKNDFAFLDRISPDAAFDPGRVAEFRIRIRNDISESIPKQLTPTEFLQRAGLLRHGNLTYAGLLLFGDNPAAILPAAIVQCVRFNGRLMTDPLESCDLQGTVPEVIVKARDFVANISRIGETPTAEGAYAETAYRFPMIAVREIIANAVVHRDYEDQESCVQIHVFSDRIEVISPGEWGGTPTVTKGQIPLGDLERHSQRRNFRLAQTLTWSKLVEGVGAGVPRAIADCEAAGAPEPIALTDDRMVKVTIFPRPFEHIKADREQGSRPLYRRIAEDLISKIDSGELRAGSRLPSEVELREQYDVSRNTARDAVRWLVARGAVQAKPGQGVFVMDKVEPFVTILDSNVALGSETFNYAHQVASQSRRPSSSPPRVEIHQVGHAVPELQLAETATVVSRHQQRFIDEVPWSLQTTFYPMDFVERGATELIQAHEIPDGALHYLEQRLGIKEAGWRDHLTVRLPDANEIAFFMLAEEGGVAAIETRRTGFGEDGKPIRLTVSVYPADRNSFMVNAGVVPASSQDMPVKKASASPNDDGES